MNEWQNDQPEVTDIMRYGADSLHELKQAFEERFAIDHVINSSTVAGMNQDGVHKKLTLPSQSHITLPSGTTTNPLGGMILFNENEKLRIMNSVGVIDDIVSDGIFAKSKYKVSMQERSDQSLINGFRGRSVVSSSFSIGNPRYFNFTKYGSGFSKDIIEIGTGEQGQYSINVNIFFEDPSGFNEPASLGFRHVHQCSIGVSFKNMFPYNGNLTHYIGIRKNTTIIDHQTWNAWFEGLPVCGGILSGSHTLSAVETLLPGDIISLVSNVNAPFSADEMNFRYTAYITMIKMR